MFLKYKQFNETQIQYIHLQCWIWDSFTPVIFKMYMFLNSSRAGREVSLCNGPRKESWVVVLRGSCSLSVSSWIVLGSEFQGWHALPKVQWWRSGAKRPSSMSHEEEMRIGFTMRGVWVPWCRRSRWGGLGYLGNSLWADQRWTRWMVIGKPILIVGYNTMLQRGTDKK